MRILHLGHLLSRTGMGVKVTVEALSRAQQELGHHVEVLGLADQCWYDGDSKKWDGAPARAIEYLGPSSFGYAPKLDDILRDSNFDLLHVHGLWTYANLLAAKHAVDRQAVLAISVHGMLSTEALMKGYWRKKAALALFQSRVLKTADIVHVTSTQEAKQVQAVESSICPEIVPFGVDVRIGSSKKHKVKNEKRHVLFLGRLAPIKGLERLLQAWHIVEHEFPQWLLEIVGPSEDNYLTQLYKLTKDLKLQSVLFSPAVYGLEKQKKIAAAEFMVLPSLSENFAMIVTECLSEGVPIIASMATPWIGLNEHDCGLWIDCEPGILSDGLQEMMRKSDAERQAMGRRGRIWMERDFSWDSVAANMLAVYQKIGLNRKQSE